MDDSRGLRLYDGGFPKQYEYSPKQLKSRSAQEFLGLTRCAACYNHNARTVHLRGGDRESSSSSEDTESETDCESEAETGSSSSCSDHIVAAAAPEKQETEKHSPVFGDGAEPECGGKDEDGLEEKGDASESLDDKSSSRGMSRRAPLVKSVSLPSSLAPHLTPLSLLPRPPRVVSTLHLQVLPEKQNDDTSFTIRQHVFEREHVNTEQCNGRGDGRIVNPHQAFQRQQTGPQWQQRSQTTVQQLHYHPQLPQHVTPLSAPGQILAPPVHAFPVLHPLAPPSASQTHVHTLTPHPCWYCYQMQFPYTYWSHYSGGQLARW